jgi:hypothetical protein
MGSASAYFDTALEAAPEAAVMASLTAAEVAAPASAAVEAAASMAFEAACITFDVTEEAAGAASEAGEEAEAAAAGATSSFLPQAIKAMEVISVTSMSDFFMSCTPHIVKIKRSNNYACLSLGMPQLNPSNV